VLFVARKLLEVATASCQRNGDGGPLTMMDDGKRLQNHLLRLLMVYR
jgi:hypothetical protein